MATIWQKAFSRIFWRNRDKGAPYTPLGESKLLPMDASIDEMDDRIVTLQQTKAEQSEFLTSISGITFDRTTGIFTITKFNGTSFTIDTDLEKIATNFDYDDDPTSAHYQQLILTLIDGTVKYVDLSALLTQYEFTDTSTIHFAVVNGNVTANVINGSITETHLAPSVMATINQKTAQAGTYADESEAWARGTIDGEPIESTEPEYHNNSKYYSEAANGFAEDSEAWAKGTRNGTDVPSTDETYHNNSKYYAEQAEASLSNTVRSFNGRNGVVVPTDGDYNIDQISPSNGAAVGQVPVIQNVGTAQEPVYKFGMQFVSGGGIGTCNSIEPFSLAFLVTVNAGFNVAIGSYLSVIFANNFYYSGGNPLRLSVNNQLYEVRINGDTPATGKTYVKSGYAGIFVYDGTYFQLIGTSGGGHVIQNQSGTAMAQEDAMQFLDSFVSDDDVNGKTIVENIKEVLPADYDSTTDEGIIVSDDGNDVPIGEIEEDVVSVTADGVKTWATLLGELWSKIDSSKVTDNALFIYDTGTNRVIYNLYIKTNNTYAFHLTRTNNSNISNGTVDIRQSNSRMFEGTVSTSETNISNISSTVPTNGTVIELHYGTSSGIVELNTDARHCMMSDGVTSVEGAINNTFKQFTFNDVTISATRGYNDLPISLTADEISRIVFCNATVIESGIDIYQCYWRATNNGVRVIGKAQTAGTYNIVVTLVFSA